MKFAEIDHFNEIRKKYSNTNKSFDGSDVPEAEGSVPDTTKVRSQIISTANELVSLIRNRGVSVQPIPEGASLQNILAFTHAFRDALKNSQASVVQNTEEKPVSKVEITKRQPKYKKMELLETKAEIERMLQNGEYLQG